VYNLSKNYKYVVYGAAVMGGYVEAGLRNAGYIISVFLDKRAETIREFRGVTVVHPEGYNNNDKENTVVIVAIQNPFEQPNVAHYLWECGYTKIIYKMAADNSIHSEYAKNLYEVYECIINGNADESHCLCEYTEGIEKVYFEDAALICNKNDFVTAYVPAELIHTDLFNEVVHNEPDKYNEMFWDFLDKPLYVADRCILNLFKAFEGNHDLENAINEMRVFCSSNPWRYSSFAKTGQDVIENRYKIYMNMNKMLNRGMSFFVDCPVELSWNEKGYFNCSDGFHRACFLITKGLTRIPAKMSVSDYNKWINKDKLEQCIFRLRENEYPNTNEMLPHPNFYNYAARRDNVGITRIQYILEYLCDTEINISEKSILCIDSNISYMPWMLEKMGANITILERQEQYFELLSDFNELFYGKNVRLINSDNVGEGAVYDITVMLNSGYLYQSEQQEKDEIRRISENTKRFLIKEVVNESEISFIINNSLFTKYEEIVKVYENGKSKALGVFYK